MKNIPPQQQPNSPQPKVSRNDFRLMVNKERMLNGKPFEQCSRLELFEMIMSFARVVGDQNRKIAKLEADKPLNKIKAFFKNLKSKFYDKSEKWNEPADSSAVKADN